MITYVIIKCDETKNKSHVELIYIVIMYLDKHC